MDRAHGIELFLGVLQCGGLGIAMVGLGRERWLRRRWALRLSR
jgi:hypothetical protein